MACVQSTPESRRTAHVPEPSPLKVRAASQSASSAKDCDAGDNDQESEEFFFLQLNTHIVGVQHNQGATLSDGECCELTRRGGTGLQVVNSSNEPVGWISKDIAPALCPLFGKCSKLRPEVLVPRGSKQKYKVPVNIAFCGPRDFGDAIAELADDLNKIQTSKAGTGIVHVREGIRVEELDGDSWKKASNGKPASSCPLLVAQKRSKSKQSDWSKAFEDICTGSTEYKDMPLAEQPQGVSSKLLEHQLKALHWVRAREQRRNLREVAPSSGSSALFWKRSIESGKDGFRNMITNTYVPAAQAPEVPKGGLLCDDMGLGKTITMLACVAADERPRSSDEGGTLVVCPLSVLPGWRAQAEQHCPSLRVANFHGAERARIDVSTPDVVLTTFQTLATDTERGDASMLDRRWRRLIVDEAHELRNSASRQTRAALKVARRCEVVWGLTGTPIQNRVEDAFSLVALLKIDPFSDKVWFNRCILRLVRQGIPLGFARLSMLLSPFILRRRKDQMVAGGPDGKRQPVLELPEKVERVKLLQLSGGHKRAHDRLAEFVWKRLSGLSKGETDRRMAEVLVLLLRLRQLCCSPALLPAGLWAELRREEPDLAGLFAPPGATGLRVPDLQALLREQVSQEDAACTICLSPLSEHDQDPVITGCGHAFHAACIEQWLGHRDSCPLCKRSSVQVIPWADEEALPHDEGDSAKVEAVLELVQQAGNDDSVVVFSQFRQLLLLLERRLSAAGARCVLVDGSTGIAERQARIAAFQARQANVALCSLKAAGAGLNLTAGNRVILVDPWWSPAAEAQAVDRCHRIGQTRPVEVVRLVVQDSVEEKVRILQSQKQGIMEGLHKSREDLRSNRIEMVMKLFQGPWIRQKTSRASAASERPAKRHRA